jgi:hypothetical protein
MATAVKTTLTLPALVAAETILPVMVLPCRIVSIAKGSRFPHRSFFDGLKHQHIPLFRDAHSQRSQVPL